MSGRAWVASIALIASAVGAGAAGARWKRRALAADLGSARDLHGSDHVGSTACRRCHESHHDSWARTFHRTMTAEASPRTVRGDFAPGVSLRHNGVDARMSRDADGGYRMTFRAADGVERTAAVARTVGSRRYQQYLAREGDSYWRLPVAYNIEERRWFPMTGAFLFADDTAIDDPARPRYGGGVFDRHVTRWNDNCVFCHNVAPNPGRDPATGGFDTSVAELGIACESCHGPGAAHVRQNADPVRRYALHLQPRADPTIVNPSRLTPARAADVCGRCHGQRITADVGPFLTHGDPFVAGDELARYSKPLARDTTLNGAPGAFAARFWADGTPRLTAYEYQGMMQSACAIKGGLTCTSCHGMHEGDPRGQIRERFSGPGASDRVGERGVSPREPVAGGVGPSEGPTYNDLMCTGCHVPFATPRAQAQHTRHDPAGEGARCVNCHMPRIVYGVLDIHRSHRIEIPRPAVADPAGRPDACSNCHIGERGEASPLAKVFSGEPVARAVAADALGRAPRFDSGERAVRLGVLLDVMQADRYPAVRHIAWRSLRRLGAAAPNYDPSADDSARAVVVARARRELGAAVVAPEPGWVDGLRAAARDADLEMGE
jgi:hypothetical protein